MSTSTGGAAVGDPAKKHVKKKIGSSISTSSSGSSSSNNSGSGSSPNKGKSKNAGSRKNSKTKRSSSKSSSSTMNGSAPAVAVAEGSRSLHSLVESPIRQMSPNGRSALPESASSSQHPSPAVSLSRSASRPKSSSNANGNGLQAVNGLMARSGSSGASSAAAPALKNSASKGSSHPKSTVVGKVGLATGVGVSVASSKTSSMAGAGASGVTSANDRLSAQTSLLARGGGSAAEAATAAGHNFSILEQLSVTSQPSVGIAGDALDTTDDAGADGYYSLLHKAQAVASQFERMYWKQSAEHLFKTTYFNPANFIVAAGFLQKAKSSNSSSKTAKAGAGAHFKKWSPRFVVLTRSVMYVYRADSSGHQHSGLIVPTGEAKIMGELTNFIDLSDVVDVQAVNHTANMFQNILLRPGFYLYIKTKSKTTLFRAAHLTEARLWASAVIEHCRELSSLVPFANVRKIVASLANPSRELLVSPLLQHGAHCRDIIAVGRVEKQRDGAIRTGWCRRTFVLTRSALLYFRRIENNASLFGEFRGSLQLSDIVDIYAETRPVLDSTQSGNFVPTSHNTFGADSRPEASPRRRRAGSSTAVRAGKQATLNSRARERVRSGSLDSFFSESDGGSSDSDVLRHADDEDAGSPSTQLRNRSRLGSQISQQDTTWTELSTVDDSGQAAALRTPLASPVKKKESKPRRRSRHSGVAAACDKVIFLQSSTRILALRVNFGEDLGLTSKPGTKAEVTEAMTQEWITLIKQAVNACCQRPRFPDVPMVNTPTAAGLDSSPFAALIGGNLAAGTTTPHGAAPARSSASAKAKAAAAAASALSDDDDVGGMNGVQSAHLNSQPSPHDLTDSEGQVSSSDESDDSDAASANDASASAAPRRSTGHQRRQRQRGVRRDSARRRILSSGDDVTDSFGAVGPPRSKSRDIRSVNMSDKSRAPDDRSQLRTPTRPSETRVVPDGALADPLATAKEFLASHQSLGSMLGVWRSSAVQIILLMDLHLVLLFFGAHPTLAHSVLLLAHIALLLEVKKLREMRDALMNYLGLMRSRQSHQAEAGSAHSGGFDGSPMTPPTGAETPAVDKCSAGASVADGDGATPGAFVSTSNETKANSGHLTPTDRQMLLARPVSNPHSLSTQEIARHMRAPKVNLAHDEFTQIKNLGRLFMPGSSLDLQSSLFAQKGSGVWSTVPGRLFLVRGPEYGPTKRKIHSLDSLYRCIAVDIFQMPHPEPGVASKFAMPEVPPLIQKRCNDHGIAPVVVLNVSLPLSRPIMFGEALSRKCVTCIVFFIIKHSTLEILDAGPSHPSYNSVNLWTRWCNQGPTDKAMRERLKIIPFINNWDEANMPAGRTLQGWNGKPTLITRSGSVIRHPQNKLVEVCVDVSRFRFLAKQMLYSFFHKAKHIELRVAFVIQANITTEEELPERVVGCFKLNKVDLTAAPEMEHGQWAS